MSTHLAARHVSRGQRHAGRGQRRVPLIMVALIAVVAGASAASLHPWFAERSRLGWSGATPTTSGLERLVSSDTGRSRSGSEQSSSRWTEVLRRLDLHRDEAWRSGRPMDLDRVFSVGTPPWYADRAALRAYLARGYTVSGARMRFWDVQVVARTAHSVRLSVVDRLADASVHTLGGAVSALPHDRPTRHVITLVDGPHGWRIAGIRAP